MHIIRVRNKGWLNTKLKEDDSESVKKCNKVEFYIFCITPNLEK